jgi:hypothetical protein
VFLLVAAPVLSDGTREAPHPWALIWAALAILSGLLFGSGVGLALGKRSKRAILIAVGAGVGMLITLWVAGSAFWVNQCPT